ncbi:MAG: nuclease [Stutzerimonas stutzeri]|nr:MAG: nuclease [Stutzerimonas stutzeri]
MVFACAIWKLSRCPTRRVRPQDIFVIDGDTITVSRGRNNREHIRISNIDAPELRGFKSLWQEKRGIAARDELRRLIEGADFVEIKPQWTQDPFGRTLARVSVVGEDHQVDVGRHLVSQGLARAWTR